MTTFAIIFNCVMALVFLWLGYNMVILALWRRQIDRMGEIVTRQSESAGEEWDHWEAEWGKAEAESAKWQSRLFLL